MTRSQDFADRRLEASQAAHAKTVADAHRAENAKRHTRKMWGCGHYPICDSFPAHEALAAHEAGLKAAQIAETIARTPMARRLMRFSLERLDESVVRWTTELELIQVSECDIETGEVVHTHFVAMLPSGLHVCRTHPDGCDAIRYVVSEKLRTLLGTPCSEPTEPIAGPTPEDDRT